MAFTDIFIRRPVLASVISLLILLVGLRALFALPVRQYPELQNTVITISTIYPGATAELMQGFITTPIEQAVASAEGIDYMTSSSSQGTSTVTVYLRLNFDAARAMTDIIAKVNQVRYLIPREANDPVVSKTTGDSTALMYIGFSSEALSMPAITDYLTRVVQPLLATVPGVASAEILGGQSFAMRLWLDPEKMAARQVSAEDVARAIQANNFQSAPGQTKGYFTVSNITADTGLVDVDQFKRLVVKVENGALVRMQDVATVELGPRSSDASVTMNGQRAVFIGVNPTPLGNPLEIVRGVRQLLPEIEKNMPPTIKAQIVFDSTKFINAAIDEVIRTLAEATVIVIVVIFLFLGSFRSVLIPIVTIPLSIIGAAALMLALGFSLNLLTLLAMVLAIGLVVDDAIVVVENVYRHIEEGLSPFDSALKGAREIVGPIISMTITLAAVYAPIGFLGGLTGALFKEFAFALAGSVVISGVIALTLSPMMCAKLLKAQPHGAEGQSGFAGFVDRRFRALENWYGRRLDRTLANRAIVLMIGAAVLACTPYFYTQALSELAPEEDQGALFGVMKGPAYANIDYMGKFGEQIDQGLAAFPENFARFVLAGGGPTAGGSAANQGFVGLIVKPWDERDRSTKDLQPLVQQQLNQVEGVQAFVFQPPPLPGSFGSLPVSMVISGIEDYATTYKLMERIKEAARKSGLFIVSDSDLNFDVPVVRLKIDHTKANDIGVTMQSIGNSLAVLLGGNYINRFDLAGRSYDVVPQVPRDFRLTPERIAQLYVPTATGQQVPLSTLLKIETATEPNALTRYNQLNSATFQAVPLPGVSMGAAVAFLKHQAAEVLPAGYNHDFLSESRQYVREGNQLAITFLFAVVVIYLVLAAQFESVRDPLIIMITVPMAISGALLPLFIGVATINIYTQIGLVTLVGLITKHGILIVQFANQLQAARNYDRRRAALEAARIRLRPILMTTAAMVVGLVPLMFATGAGAASRFSIGIVIIAGMLIGTVFTLFVVPTIYSLLAGDHRRKPEATRALAPPPSLAHAAE